MRHAPLIASLVVTALTAPQLDWVGSLALGVVIWWSTRTLLGACAPLPAVHGRASRTTCLPGGCLYRREDGRHYCVHCGDPIVLDS